MACPPVHLREDNPRTLTHGLSPVHVDNYGVNVIYSTYISADQVQFEMIHAYVVKDGIVVLVAHASLSSAEF